MPAADFAAIARWPNVPDCYGWLSLDRRGHWRLQGELIGHAGLVDFIGRQYVCGSDGRCFFQNGPQRVFVALEYTPWVFRLEQDGRLTTHTGEPAGAAEAAFIDDEGNLLLLARPGIGVLDDRDLASFLGQCDGDPATGGGSWRGLPIGLVRRSELAGRFGFVAEPAA